MKKYLLLASSLLLGCGNLTISNDEKTPKPDYVVGGEGPRLQSEPSPVKPEVVSCVEAAPEIVSGPIKSKGELVQGLLEKCLKNVYPKNRAMCAVQLDATDADEKALAQLIADDMAQGSTYFIAKADKLHIYYPLSLGKGEMPAIDVIYDGADRDKLSEEEIHSELKVALQELVEQLSKVAGSVDEPVKSPIDEEIVPIDEVKPTMITSPKELAASLFETCIANVSSATQTSCALVLRASHSADEKALIDLIAQDKAQGSTYFIAKMDELHVYYPNHISEAGEAKILVTYDGQAELTKQQIELQLQTALEVLVLELGQTYGH